MSTDEKQPLDIDAWIDGAELPEAEVTLAAKGKSLALRNDLIARRAKDLRARGEKIEPGRMVRPSTKHELDEQIDQLDAEVKASERTFLLRGIDGDTHQRILRERKAADDDAQAALEHLVAACTVEPKLTPEQVHRLRQRVGEGQFKLLAAAMNEISFEAPDIDF